MGRALEFEIVARCAVTKARVARLKLPHALVDTPVFMPVGTQGTMKGMTADQLEALSCNMILGNTYHLGLRPGQEVMDAFGGLHKFMKWDHGLLTDSGGFQMVSLLKLAKITEDGVEFQSPHDGSTMLLTPEKSILLQNSIGADIMMQLDDVVSSLTCGPRVEEAMFRSIRWLDRCIKAHARPDQQNLFAIVQGGLDENLRKTCIQGIIEVEAHAGVNIVVEMVKRDLPGYAIGGLSGGEEKDRFWRMVDLSTDHLPENKPRYCMGVGYALDLVVCSALGVDMFDCVFPTRTARFGNALTRFGPVNLRHKAHEFDDTPIDPEIVGRDAAAASLMTIHNVAYQMSLMRGIRSAIVQGTFPAFIRQFVKDLHPNGDVPPWAVNALAKVNVDLTDLLKRDGDAEKNH